MNRLVLSGEEDAEYCFFLVIDINTLHMSTFQGYVVHFSCHMASIEKGCLSFASSQENNNKEGELL